MHKNNDQETTNEKTKQLQQVQQINVANQNLSKNDHSDEDLPTGDDGGMLWKDFVAGNFGGIAGIMAGHPFDTVKTRIQTQPHKYSTNVLKTLVDIMKQESVFGLYKGMAPPIVGVGILNAIIFGVYGNTMRFLDTYRGIVDDDEEGRHRTVTEFYTDIFIAGALGGFVNCFVCSPLELVKTRLQIQDQSAAGIKLYNGPIDCLMKTWRQAGVKGLFRGMVPTILREVPSYGVYFVGYEFLKSRWGDSPVALLMAGGSAGVLCWIISYPFDMIKSRVQAVPDYPTPGYDLYKGVWDCTVKSCKTEGYSVLFRGLNAAIVRAFPVNAMTFFTYEMTMKILNASEEDDDEDESL